MRAMRVPWLHFKRAFIVTVLVAIFSIGIPNRYESDAKIIPQLLSGDASTAGALSAAAAMLGVSIGGGASDPGSIHMDVIQSRWMADKLLNTKFRYNTKTWMFGKDQVCHQTLLEYMDLDNRDKAVLELQNAVLAADRDLKSGTIRISVLTRSPQLSQLVVQSCITYLQEFLKNQGQFQAGAKARFLILRISEATEEMEKSESVFRDFLKKNQNYGSSLDPNVKLTGMRLESDLNTKKQVLTSLLIAKEQAVIAEKNDLGQLTVLDAGNLPELKTSPRRGFLAISSFVLILICSLIWENRKELAEHFSKESV